MNRLKSRGCFLAFAGTLASLSAPTSGSAAEPSWNGPIRVAPDHKHFDDANGKPFFWLGDTAWAMIAKLTPEQTEAYLDNRAKKGFTVIQTVIAWGNGTGSETKTPLPNTDGNKVWINDDPAKPNEAYFRRVDLLVKAAAARGLVMALLPTWGYYVNNQPVLKVDNARAYGRWLGKRYRAAQNIVWVNGGDRDATEHKDVWRALAQGLQQGCQAKQMITYHPCGWCASSRYFHDEPWLAFNMIETFTQWTQVYPAVTTDLMRVPAKPVVLAEGAYEDGRYPLGVITPLLARRQAWWSVMAGGYHTYGQSKVWGMSAGWEEGLDAPGAAQMGIMRDIVTAFPYRTMLPDQSIFASGIGSEGTLNAAVITPSADRALVYLSSRNPVFLHLDHIAAKQVKATFVDPSSGKRLDPVVFSKGVQPFTLPTYWEDGVLLLEGVL